MLGAEVLAFTEIPRGYVEAVAVSAAIDTSLLCLAVSAGDGVEGAFRISPVLVLHLAAFWAVAFHHCCTFPSSWLSICRAVSSDCTPSTLPLGVAFTGF